MYHICKGLNVFTESGIFLSFSSSFFQLPGDGKLMSGSEYEEDGEEANDAVRIKVGICAMNKKVTFSKAISTYRFIIYSIKRLFWSHLHNC